MLPRPIHSPRALLGSALLATGLLASALAPHDADAAMSAGCDPIVTLSNGAVVHLTATITAPPTDLSFPRDITGVTYRIVAPVGTRVVSVVYPVDPTNIPQTFTFAARNPSGVWDAYTYVATTTSGIGVMATAQVQNYATFSATGVANQDVRVHVTNGSVGSVGSVGSAAYNN